MKENNNGVLHFLLLLIFLSFTIGLTLIYLEVHDRNVIERSKFSHELSESFNRDRIDSAIEGEIGTGVPLLIKNGGRWRENDINYYLGYFELLSDYIDAGSLNMRDVFDNYSEDVLIAYTNPEIQQYIADLRKEGKDGSYYIKFERMAKMFQEMNKKPMK